MKLTFVVVISLALIASCTETNEVVQPPRPLVHLTVTNLPRLGEGQGHYQLWATFTIFAKKASPQHDSDFVNLGEFNVTPDGQTLVTPDDQPVRFEIPEGQNAQLLSDCIIAIQAEEGTGPARIHHEEPGPPIIGGKFRGDAQTAIAELTVSYVDAFGTDFSSLTGKYAFLAPTSVPVDSNSGVWFVDRTSSLAAGLVNLPTLPAEWTYEGWLVDNVDPTHPAFYSTGKFLRANTADFDSAGPGRGSAGFGLDFPGQDFINGTPSRPNLTNGRYVFRITLEPKPDNSPEPFFLLLLTSEVSLAQSSAPFTLYNVAETHIPRATLIVER
jgi:hypothetical protein